MRISDWSSDVCSSDLPDRAARADGIEPVLRTQLRRDVARAERHADDAPVAVARGHRIVGVDRLMRAVEGANADMDDARCLRRAVIARPLPRRRGRHLRPYTTTLSAPFASLWLRSAASSAAATPPPN